VDTVGHGNRQHHLTGGGVTVALVGAGPGDPGLLTVRGAALLGRAEVVVHDRLIAPELLALAPSGAELIDVGKAPGSSTPSPRSSTG